MKYCVFIHTNHKQVLGAKVAAYALKRNSATPDAFDVQYIDTRDHPWMAEQEGQIYLRDGVKRVWLNDDLQSFTPLRFRPPELMGYEGRALVIDPDIFAVGDVFELLSRDMGDHAILCRKRSGPKGAIDKCWASSVMLLDCAKLPHWNAAEGFRQLFAFERDYSEWICLKLEDPSTIGVLEPEWNDFDKLTKRTKMLHTTRRKTQPWKTGLPADWRPAERFRAFPPLGWLMRARRKLFGEYAFLPDYQKHPDPNQEHLFFGLLRECLEQGLVTEAEIRSEMDQNHVRHDAFDVLEKTKPLAAPPNPPLELPA
ncbi:MAG: hypothetical protein V2J24_23770 [Pseudomonadales bacterium]|jgi:hypothetical protein|nr:hypothetical protein [Pseudomonadales bacterium]